MTGTRMTRNRTAGRPTASLITAKKITLATQELLAKNGDFTMSQLAKKLGVAPSSLYNHVASRDEVLAGLSDRVAQGISTRELQDAAARVSAGNLTASAARDLWIEATASWARSYRSAFSLSPALVATLAVTPVRSAPGTLGMYEQVTSAFVAFGLSPRDALLTVEALEAFLLGSATDVHAPIDIFDPGQRASSHPTMAEGFAALGPTPQNDAFELGLAALLAGLSTRLP